MKIKLLIFSFFIATISWANSYAANAYWQCYESITCKNGVCSGKNGIGSYSIKPILAFNKVIPDGTYYFGELSVASTETGLSPIRCDYGNTNQMGSFKLVATAFALGNINMSYFKSLSSSNPNLHLRTYPGVIYPASMIECGYASTKKSINDPKSCLFPAPPSPAVNPSVSQANTISSFYVNSMWDPKCAACWPSPFNPLHDNCKPSDCAIMGVYTCKAQTPPLALDDDPRLVTLIKNNQCSISTPDSRNPAEASYVQKLNSCFITDEMAGRFSTPPNKDDIAKHHDYFMQLNTQSYAGMGFNLTLLAQMYDAGQGVTQDRVKATQLFTIAAQQGDLLAKYSMAVREADGIGTTRDKQAAMKYLNDILNVKNPSIFDSIFLDQVTPCAKLLIDRLNGVTR